LGFIISYSEGVRLGERVGDRNGASDSLGAKKFDYMPRNLIKGESYIHDRYR
jgi:hypothetical protein